MPYESTKSLTAGRMQGSRTEEKKAPFPDAIVIAAVDKDEILLPASFADHDPDCPKNWPAVRRWSTVVATSLMMALSIFARSIIIPSAPQILGGFNVSELVYRTLIVTIWDLGEALSPFLIGPLSESFGRSPIYHGGNVIGLLMVLITSFSADISMFSAFRFFSGFFLTSPVLVPAIIGDVCREGERGVALSISQAFTVLSPFLAPIVGAYINSGLGWRWVLWILSIIMSAVVGLNLLTVRETYTPKILDHKLRHSHNIREADPELSSAHRTLTLKNFLDGALRPMKLVFGSRHIFLIALYQGVVGGIQALMSTTLTEIMESQYHFGHGAVGLAFIAPSIGLMLATLFYGSTSDRYLKHEARKNSGILQPKHLLAYTLLGSFILPCGLLFYGWTLRYRLPFMVPLIGTAIIGFSFLLTILPIANYLVDAFELYSASAIAGCTVLYLTMVAIFPLIGPSIFQTLGYGWGNSLLALISALFIPFLVKLMFWEPSNAG